MVKVSEIFMSYQGEGPQIGSRTLFIRLQGYNLSCDWCDTKYAGSLSESKGSNYSAQELLEFVENYKITNSDFFDICITGGEPMLQQRDEELNNFLREVSCTNHMVTLETNGTVPPTDEFIDHFSLVVISPKLLACGGHGEVNAKNLDRLVDAVMRAAPAGRAVFKYVVDPEMLDECIQEIREIDKQAPVDYNDIYLMPLGTTDSEIINGMKAIKQYCTDHGVPYNITTRLHCLAGMR